MHYNKKAFTSVTLCFVQVKRYVNYIPHLHRAVVKVNRDIHMKPL